MCGNEKEISFEKYITSKENGGYYACNSKCAYEKTKNTCLKKYGDEYYNNHEKCRETKLEKYGNEYYNNLEKVKKTIQKIYGVDNVFQNEDIKEKCRQTCLRLHNKEHNSQVKEVQDKIRATNIKLKNWIPTDFASEFKKYSHDCRLKTENLRKNFIENWDKLDYYDGEYIGDNFKLYNQYDLNYPHLDHIISIRYGFDNNLPIDIICCFDNLCYTKAIHNLSKRHKSEEEYKKSLID